MAPGIRLAGGLAARGVGPGDVVAMQLPNWMEAAATFWASALLGAVVVPVVHFYGRKELTHILGDAKPRVFITAESFGHLQFDAEVATLREPVAPDALEIQKRAVRPRKSDIAIGTLGLCWTP